MSETDSILLEPLNEVGHVHVVSTVRCQAVNATGARYASSGPKQMTTYICGLIEGSK